MSSPVRISISAAQLRAFEMLSHDKNPLHNDPLYARSTQFGRPVVYGMCGVLAGLAQWAGGRAFRLIRIQGWFGKPLFESVKYELNMAENGDQVQIEFREGGVVQISIDFCWATRDGEPRTGLDQGTPLFQPRATANDADVEATLAQWQGANHLYSICAEGRSQWLSTLGLESPQMPVNQLNALMGSSYLVGMEIPGRQALYSRFEFEFETDCSDETTAGFEFRNVSASFDSRYNRVSISGCGTGLRSFSLFAFKRPEPVRYGINAIQQAASQGQSFRNDVVFISGATRGFGSVLAKMLAIQKAKVLVNYRSNQEAVQNIVNEVRPWNNQVIPIAGDVSNPDTCREMKAEIEAQVGRIDLLISNAFPQITAKGFLEQSSWDFLHFLEKSMSATVTLFHELLPLVPKGGTVILISTCFTQVPESHFSHYIAAKSGLEGLMRCLALEFPDQQFVIARPPRMLTDQTNLPFDLSPPMSAIEVGRKLLASIKDYKGDSNLIEIDIAPPEQTGGDQDN